MSHVLQTPNVTKNQLLRMRKNIFDSAVPTLGVPEIKMIIIYLIPINRNINQCSMMYKEEGFIKTCWSSVAGPGLVLALCPVSSQIQAPSPCPSRGCPGLSGPAASPTHHPATPGTRQLAANLRTVTRSRGHVTRDTSRDKL